MPNAGPEHGSVILEPETPREMVVDAIALEAATGSSVSQLARRFGYTYGGMYALCTRADFVARRDYYRKRILDEKYVGQAKVLLHLNPMLDAHLSVALPTNSEGELDPVLAVSKVSIAAREYLIDKVMPTVTKVESTNEVKNAPETVEVLTELRTVLRRINSEREGIRDISILDSPHVLEGTAALPSPLLAEKTDGS